MVAHGIEIRHKFQNDLNAKKRALSLQFCFAMKLVNVVGDGAKDSFSENIGSTPSCKPFEMIILLQNPKGPFGLDATVKAQNFALFRSNARGILVVEQ